MLRVVAGTLLVVTASCTARSDAPTRQSSATTASTAGLSPRRNACTSDDQCALFNSVNEHVGQPGGPSSCCMDSTLPTAAASRDWVTELEKFCATLPPGPCPGGNEPPSRGAACQAGSCVVAR